MPFLDFGKINRLKQVVLMGGKDLKKKYYMNYRKTQLKVMKTQKGNIRVTTTKRGIK